MTDMTLFQGNPEEEERFKYEVIRGLSESIRQLAAGMAKMQETQVDMLIRLAKLEENKWGEALAKTEARDDVQDARIDALFKDKDRRDGAYSTFSALRIWGPVIFGFVITCYLLGRSMGLIPSPPATVTKIEAQATTNERRDDMPPQRRERIE